MSIRMVADYYYKKEKKEMTATEWLSTLEITMNNNIRRKSGTKKENIIRALTKLDFVTQIIKGADYKAKLLSVRQAISRKHPVIVYCLIRPEKQEKPYPHFAVVVWIDNNSIYIRDPYPRKRNTQRPRKISFDVFGAASPVVGELVWGRTKWGIEVIK